MLTPTSHKLERMSYEPLHNPAAHRCVVSLLHSGSYLIDESIWAGVVVGEGFINHQEHDAGEEGQCQDDQDGHLQGGQMLVINLRLWFIYMRQN